MQHNKVFRDYRHLARLFKDGPEFVAFDTETTGLYPDTGRVIEIGAVKFDATGILDTYNVLINPECSISPHTDKPYRRCNGRCLPDNTNGFTRIPGIHRDKYARRTQCGF